MSTEYVIHLNKLVRTPRTRKANKALFEIRKFACKHTHAQPKNVRISNEVNEKVWEQGKFRNVPRFIIVMRKQEEKVYVFLPNGKDLKAFEEKQKTEAKKDKTTTKTPTAEKPSKKNEKPTVHLKEETTKPTNEKALVKEKEIKAEKKEMEAEVKGKQGKKPFIPTPSKQTEKSKPEDETTTPSQTNQAQLSSTEQGSA